MPVQHTLGQRPLGLLKASHAVYKLLGGRKIATSFYHLNVHGRVECVNHTKI